MTKEICTINPDLHIEFIEKENGIAAIIDGKTCLLSPESALNISLALDEMSKKLFDKQAESEIEDPEYWEDYLLEAKYINVTKSRLLIDGVVWVVHHDDIRDFISDYTMDKYSQIYSDLNEMSSNGLISKES